MAPSRDIEQASDDGIILEDAEPSRRPCFSRKKKIMIAVFNVTAVACVLGVLMSRSKTNVRSANQLNGESPYGTNGENEISAASGSDESSTYEEDAAVESEGNADSSSVPKKEVTDFDSITVYDGPIPAIISARNSLLYRLTCEPSEVSVSLDLVTDGYAWETTWEIIRPDGTQLAFGPPTGQTYERMTSYTGELCLPAGSNILVMNDQAGDGLCCTYGNGKMTISANGETLVETGDEDFKTKEYPFEIFTNGNTGVSTTSAATIGIDSVSSTGMASTTSSAGMASTTTDMMATSAATTSTAMATTTADNITSAMTTSTVMASTTGVGLVSSTDMASTSTVLLGGSTTTDIASTTSAGSVGDGDYCLTVEVMTDQHSKSETAYALTSKPSNKNEDPVVYISKAVGELENEQLYSDTVCVPAGTYELYVEDSFRGLCCSGGQGYYAVQLDGEEILYGGSFANFPGESVTHEIVVGGDFGASDRAAEWLNAHNSRRETFHEAEGTEYKPLVWSNSLEKDAANWLKEIFVDCKTVREPGMAEGENLSFRKVGGPRDTEEPENILNRWVGLKMGKDYPDNSSLTQVMWRGTRYVGCSDGSKTMSSGEICYASICRYARAGNCVMGKYDDWKEATLADRTTCGPVCPDDGCH